MLTGGNNCKRVDLQVFQGLDRNNPPISVNRFLRLLSLKQYSVHCREGPIKNLMGHDGWLLRRPISLFTICGRIRYNTVVNKL